MPPHIQRQQATQILAADVGRLLQQTLQRFAASESEAPELWVDAAAHPIAPARLARVHPGGRKAQQQAEQLYLRCLSQYRQTVRPQDLPRGQDDAAAALAFFVAASCRAHQGVEVEAAALRAVERQMGRILCLSERWHGAELTEKQCYVEQSAVLGVLMADAWTQARPAGGAAVSNVRRAARSYLGQLVGLDPARITLGPQGLALRDAITH